jgi:cell division protein FtsI (penicillin-binding protein 3)
MISTIDVYIQDIAHHALLKQLEEYEADHGCVVVMETETGKVRAISNLGRANDGTYYETTNYAVAESHEPGSTFKLVDLMAILEDKVADTSTIYDTNGDKIFRKSSKGFA